MSLVAISGNASGTGTLTIAAPNTNSNRTLTLPDSTGTLIVGTNGITAESNGGTGTTTGYYGFKNRIINGAMAIDQRNAGASVSGNAVYCLDRWLANASQNNKYTVQRNAGSVTPPAGFINYLGVTSSSAYSVGASEQFSIIQPIEGLNVADLGWGTANAATVTLSFWVRSSLTGTFGGCFTNSAANRFYVFSYTISAANTWEQKTVTVAGDTSGTWLTTNGIGIYVWLSIGAGSSVSGTAGSWGASTLYQPTGATSVVGTNGATFYITGVQLEKGSTATSFDYRPYGTELVLCQRYLPCFNTTGTTGFEIGVGFYATTTIARITVAFPVETRVSPTGVTAVNPANFTANGNANSIPSAIAYGGAGTKSGVLDVTIPSTSITAGYGVHLFGNASGTGQIQFTGCEL
jgi:hypothetical protein